MAAMALVTSGAPDILDLIGGGMENGGMDRDVGGAVGAQKKLLTHEKNLIKRRERDKLTWKERDFPTVRQHFWPGYNLREVEKFAQSNWTSLRDRNVEPTFLGQPRE